MKRRVSALEARRQLGELLEGVYYRGDEVVIERAGKPMAVVVPIERYESIERGRDRLMELFQKSWEGRESVLYDDVRQQVDDLVREARGQKQRKRESA